MNDLIMNRRQGTWMLFAILASGLMLFIACVALLVLVYQNTNETIENRRIGCISRYLDGSKYAPQCNNIIKEYTDGQQPRVPGT